MSEKYCLLTNDVETTSIWLNELRDNTGDKVLKEGMPILLDIYNQYNIKSTFFFTAHIARLYPEVVKMILPFGHEVGSHGLTHHKVDGFDDLPFEDQVIHLRESKKILEDITGQEVVSFRSPALRMSDRTVLALMEAGYKIDSSVASQRFDMFLSFGGIQKLKWLTSPRLPYRASRESIYKKGHSEIIEVPLTAMIFPYVGTTMRIFPWITNMIKHFVNLESSVTGKPVVFDIHPNEFIDESDQPRRIKKRSDHLFASLLQDTIRSRLKVRNLGEKAIPLYQRRIEFFQSLGYTFCSVKE